MPKAGHRPLRIVVAPDSLKGSLSARTAAAAIATGLHQALPDASIDVQPLADGGEGTLDVLVEVMGARKESATVHDPLGRPITANWGWEPTSKTAIIEMAQASGLHLVSPAERDLWNATSYGTGELISLAMERNPRHIIIGLGGTATNDGGAGILQAMGGNLLDHNGRPIPPGPAGLRTLATANINSIRRRSAHIKVTLLTDVRNPLTGLSGATAIYGPQKGLRANDWYEMDRVLGQLATTLAGGHEPRPSTDLAGGGAAGGAAYALAVAMNGQIISGAKFIIDITGLAAKIATADFVFTAEGHLDHQTAQGKLIAHLANQARAAKVPLIALAGKISASSDELAALGITAALSITNGPISEHEAMSQAEILLREQVTRIGTLLSLGIKKAPR